MNKNSSPSNTVLSRRINGNEIIAWIVLVCAVVLFSFSIAVAQDSKSTEKSTVHIKIEKNENGKVTSIDTTVSKDKLPELQEYLKESGIDLGTDEQEEEATHVYSYSDSDSDNDDKVVRIHRNSKMSKEEKEELKKEMEKVHETMAKMKDEMKDIHIEINGDDLSDNFNFDMDMPSAPHAPGDKACPHIYMFKSDGDDDEDGGKGSKRQSFKYQYFFNEDVPDSLNDDNHIVIRGKKGEDKPELEKEITGKNGEKIFIFKRKLPKEESAEVTKSSLGISRVKVYPNPGNGNISVSFLAKSKGDLTISVTDAKGKEVYSDKKRDFSGEFFNQIDLSAKGKGAYFVKITQGDDSVTKKIIIE